MIVKFTYKYKIVKWTESRVSKHLLTNKNYLELFLLILVFPTDLSVAKEVGKKTEELSCNSMVIVPHVAAQDRSFLSFLHI